MVHRGRCGVATPATLRPTRRRLCTAGTAGTASNASASTMSYLLFGCSSADEPSAPFHYVPIARPPNPFHSLSVLLARHDGVER
eukprot:6175565-Pleurochrysis_carterae.AAC.2